MQVRTKKQVSLQKLADRRNDEPLGNRPEILQLRAPQVIAEACGGLLMLNGRTTRERHCLLVQAKI